jgi:hypothetical protein
MSTLPKQVVVGHRTWKIRKLSKRESKRLGAAGICSSDSDTLFVFVDGQSGPVQANTLLHEIGHAIWEEAGLTHGDGEERIVAITANLMTQVIRDNPDVFDWIAEKARS